MKNNIKLAKYHTRKDSKVVIDNRQLAVDHTTIKLLFALLQIEYPFHFETSKNEVHFP